MNLHRLLQQRAASGKPVRVGLIGSGKFGSMFLNQAPMMPGVEIAVIADLDHERARQACHTIGWEEAQLARTRFVSDGRDVGRSGKDADQTGAEPLGRIFREISSPGQNGMLG